jgi:uncharacterized protein
VAVPARGPRPRAAAGDGARPGSGAHHAVGRLRRTIQRGGYACLVSDYRNFGDSDGRPRQLLDVGMQLADWAVAVAYARTLGDVDHSRIGLWGTSFAGGHVIATAARLPGIAAAVAQCPFTDGVASVRVIKPFTTARITTLAIRDVLGARLGKSPVMVPTAGKPGEVALMTATDVYAGYLGLVPEGVELRNEVAARIVLKVITYRPGRLAAKITCPILFCVCEADSVAPAVPTLRYAAKAPRGEVRLYPEGHFAIYVDPKSPSFRACRYRPARFPRQAAQTEKQLTRRRFGRKLSCKTPDLPAGRL